MAGKYVFVDLSDGSYTDCNVKVLETRDGGRESLISPADFWAKQYMPRARWINSDELMDA